MQDVNRHAFDRALRAEPTPPYRMFDCVCRGQAGSSVRGQLSKRRRETLPSSAEKSTQKISPGLRRFSFRVTSVVHCPPGQALFCQHDALVRCALTVPEEKT